MSANSGNLNIYCFNVLVTAIIYLLRLSVLTQLDYSKIEIDDINLQKKMKTIGCDYLIKSIKDF